MTNIVVVESPAKAKTIEKYLGRDFKVLASYGHVRDLPSREGSIEPDNDFAMHYSLEARGTKNVKAISDALKGATNLYLATDPDREGEAISWHLVECLAQKKGLKDIKVHRITFNEITRTAVNDAMRHPREIDMNLVNAQQARRALDYLVGFTLSPLLWRKLPGARSAGRVQSVALRLVCEREIEIEAFKAREYWTIEADFISPEGAKFTARLAGADGKKLDKFDIPDEATALKLAERIAASEFRVRDVSVRPEKRHPRPPFTTSTLQQEASRKLGFSPQITMRIAQQLYEGVDIGGETVGIITYMRTDGVQMANEAVHGARDLIAGEFGREYVPGAPRHYKQKQTNAQEAHEAIRPTDFHRMPQSISRHLSDDQRRLYDLIWKRAVASQMESAEIEATVAEIASVTDQLQFRASGSVVTFAGFLKLYDEDIDDRSGDDEGGSRLPKLAANDALSRETVKPERHFTEPPPRYSEASLVKKLEELGIGRPSTYAAILEVLRERGYLRLEKKRLVPEDNGRLVTAFLTGFFEHYFAYDFTARLEEQLDEVTEGRADWKKVLADFWRDFSRHDGQISIKAAIDHIDKAMGNRGVVITTIDEALGPHFFPVLADGADPRLCPACSQGRLGIKAGRNGAFIGCGRYPECSFTRPLGVPNGENGVALSGPKLLGVDPDSNLEVTLRTGRFGPYIQLGEAQGKEKPKRASVPKSLGVAPENVELELALRLLSLPRNVGEHPESKLPVLAGLGRFGPYLLHDGKYVKLASAQEALEIGLNRAVDLIAEAKNRPPGRGRRPEAEPLRQLGSHPEDGLPVVILNGRYGPYFKHGGLNATLPRGLAVEEATLEAAIAALAARAANSGGRKGKPVRARKTTAAKAPAAKTPKAAKGKPVKPGSDAEATAKKPAKKPTAKAASKKTVAAAGNDDAPPPPRKKAAGGRQ